MTSRKSGRNTTSGKQAMFKKKSHSLRGWVGWRPDGYWDYRLVSKKLFCAAIYGEKNVFRAELRVLVPIRPITKPGKERRG